MNIGHRANWTEDRINMLSQLHRAGKTGGEIAKELGGVSRNAVIGKIHRLGLAPKANKIVSARRSQVSTRTTRGTKSAAPRRTSGPPRVASVAVIDDTPPKKPISILELDSNACRWPYSVGPRVMFGCKCKAIPGQPYCEGHAARAFNGLPQKRPSTEPKPRLWSARAREFA